MDIQELTPRTPSRTGSVAIDASRAVKARGSDPGEVTPALRYALIAERAYIKGCQRGFVNGSTEEDWFHATEEIDHLIRTRRT
jgi:hypothetical protein